MFLKNVIWLIKIYWKQKMDSYVRAQLIPNFLYENHVFWRFGIKKLLFGNILLHHIMHKFSEILSNNNFTSNELDKTDFARLLFNFLNTTPEWIQKSTRVSKSLHASQSALSGVNM